jgi:hypothetical protein
MNSIRSKQIGTTFLPLFLAIVFHCCVAFAGQSQKVSIHIHEQHLKAKKPFSVDVRNGTSKTISFCTEYRVTAAEGVARRPIFSMERKSGGRWVLQLTSDDTGRVVGPITLKAGESKDFRIQTTNDGEYRLGLDYVDGDSGAVDCAKPLPHPKHANSRPFTISDK